MNVAEIVKAVRNLPSLSPEEGNLIVAAMKAKIRERDSKLAGNFHIGDRVHFVDRFHSTHEGLIQKINEKTIKVAVDSVDGEKLSFPKIWKVSPSLVMKSVNFEG